MPVFEQDDLPDLIGREMLFPRRHHGGPGECFTRQSDSSLRYPPEHKGFLKLRDEKGFTAFKWRVGAECGRDRDEWPGRTEAIVPMVAKALGDDVDKLVDANSGFSPARAIEVGRMLESEGIGHFEEPCPYWEFAQTKEVRDALALDVAGGEQDCEFTAWSQMIGMGVAAIPMLRGALERTAGAGNGTADGAPTAKEKKAPAR